MGPVMPVLNHKFIARIEWMRNDRMYINLEISVIALTLNGVSFHLYPVEIYKLLNNTVFVHLTEAEG